MRKARGHADAAELSLIGLLTQLILNGWVERAHPLAWLGLCASRDDGHLEAARAVHSLFLRRIIRPFTVVV
ncbi:hypothetical protein BAE36_02015 [Rhizobium leguminosarum bv. trifolii]|nr:hypothetical protein BAE36_02015 [Rhizobium leguminosarum bv. trifolii]